MTESKGRLPGEIQGPIRDKKVVTGTATNGYTAANAFLLQAGAAGDVVYRTIEGTLLTETLAAGAFVNVAGIPVMCREVLANGTTIDTLIIGLP